MNLTRQRLTSHRGVVDFHSMESTHNGNRNKKRYVPGEVKLQGAGGNEAQDATTTTPPALANEPSRVPKMEWGR